MLYGVHQENSFLTSFCFFGMPVMILDIAVHLEIDAQGLAPYGGLWGTSGHLPRLNGVELQVPREIEVLSFVCSG